MRVRRKQSVPPTYAGETLLIAAVIAIKTFTASNAAAQCVVYPPDAQQPSLSPQTSSAHTPAASTWGRDTTHRAALTASRP